jgi:flagellar hook-associated protein 2
MAGSINFMGTYSGIDQSTIDQLMQVERLPLNQLNNKKTSITAEKNAWKDVNTRLNSLFTRLKELQNIDIFTSRTATLSDKSVISATASKDAVVGTYQVKVEQLASNTRLTGDEIANVYDEKGAFAKLDFTGSFTIKNSDYNSDEPSENTFVTIEISPEDTLKTIVDKINDKSKDTGMSATIINSRLVLTDEKTGARDIILEDDGSGTLSNLGLSGKSAELGKTALLSINGIEVESNSNTVKDAVLGLTINLNKVHAEGEYDTITVKVDTEKLTKSLQAFVDQYNSTMSFIEDQLAVGTVTGEGTTGRGTLAGDSSLRSLATYLRRMVTDRLSGNEGTTIDNISQLGIATTGKSSVLSFDSSKLLDEFSKDPQNVINFFSNKVEDKDQGFISRLSEKIDSYISTKDGHYNNSFCKLFNSCIHFKKLMQT